MHGLTLFLAKVTMKKIVLLFAFIAIIGSVTVLSLYKRRAITPDIHTYEEAMAYCHGRGIECHTSVSSAVRLVFAYDTFGSFDGDNAHFYDTMRSLSGKPFAPLLHSIRSVHSNSLPGLNAQICLALSGDCAVLRNMFAEWEDTQFRAWIPGDDRSYPETWSWYCNSLRSTLNHSLGTCVTTDVARMPFDYIARMSSITDASLVFRAALRRHGCGRIEDSPSFISAQEGIRQVSRESRGQFR